MTLTRKRKQYTKAGHAENKCQKNILIFQYVDADQDPDRHQNDATLEIFSRKLKFLDDLRGSVNMNVILSNTEINFVKQKFLFKLNIFISCVKA